MTRLLLRERVGPIRRPRASALLPDYVASPVLECFAATDVQRRPRTTEMAKNCAAEVCEVNAKSYGGSNKSPGAEKSAEGLPNE